MATRKVQDARWKALRASEEEVQNIKLRLEYEEKRDEYTRILTAYDQTHKALLQERAKVQAIEQQLNTSKATITNLLTIIKGCKSTMDQHEEMIAAKQGKIITQEGMIKGLMEDRKRNERAKPFLLPCTNLNLVAGEPIPVSSMPAWIKKRYPKIASGEFAISLVQLFILSEFLLMELTISPEAYYKYIAGLPVMIAHKPFHKWGFEVALYCKDLVKKNKDE